MQNWLNKKRASIGISMYIYIIESLITYKESGGCLIASTPYSHSGKLQF